MNDLNQTLSNLLNKIASEDLGLIISVAAIVVTLLLVWLILRKPRLWYWKVDERAGTLKKIETRLKKVEKQMDEELTVVAVGPKDSRNLEHEGGQEPKTLEALSNESEKAQESEDPINIDPAKNTYTGKSGRIYTRQELESQIRD